MFRVDRDTSLRHPRAGEWTAPQYHTTDSIVRPYNGHLDVSGYGAWVKDGLKASLTADRWRIPLFCDANGRVFGRINQRTVTAP